jgi:RES domain-containing protein
LNSVRIPRALVYVRIEIPDDTVVEEVEASNLRGWDSPDRAASQRFGDGWYDERRSLVLLVPSLAAPELERNVLIFQRHPEFPRVTASLPHSIRCHPKLLV